MSNDDILSSALALPPSQRARLAHELLQSLDEGDEATAEHAWLNEMMRRAAEMDSDARNLEDWSDIRSRIEDRLHAKSP
ncbi:MAG TPA: addiction module protein [Polyangiaceae bacterium]|jgi:putative addiction module component (TIGR02574 family)|nr:addiction module protein [Polyangiaceae bacterium]